MAREKYHRKFRKVRPPAAVVARYLRFWDDRALFADPLGAPHHVLDAPTVFGDDRPVWLDVGCSAGEYMLSQAVARPDWGFVGVDISPKPLYYAVNEAAKLGLDNVLFVRANVRLVFPLLGEGSLAAVTVLFPPPFTKPQHYHHRLVDVGFAEAMARAMRAGARLTLMTDDAGYFGQMKAVFGGDSRFAVVREEVGMMEPALTRYQAAKQALGLVSHGVWLVRR